MNNQSSTLKLSVVVSSEELSNQVDKTVDVSIKDVTVKGFRKGKAPKNLAISHLDPDKITQIALSTLLPKKLEQELLKERESSKRSRTILIEEPHYEMLEKAKEDGSLEFSVTCILYPEVNTDPVEKISIERVTPKDNTDEEINDFIKRLYTNFQKTKQPKTIKEETNLETSNQEDITIEEVLKDEQFINIMNVKGAQELITRVKEELSENARYDSELEMETKLINEMQQAIEIDMPEVMIQREVERLRSDLKAQLQKFGAKFEDYIASREKSEEDIAKEMIDQARSNVSLMLILTELVQKWDIKLTEQEVNEVKKSKNLEHAQTLELMLKQRKALEEAKSRLIK
jgi:FKBP-type peptidyl-prolyl cis-trans isomerase (trigger factor)